MSKKFRIKQYYTTSPDVYADFVTGYKRYYKELIHKFVTDYSLSITSWEPSSHQYGYDAEKCFLTFNDKLDIIEYYLYYQTNYVGGNRMGLHSLDSQIEPPDGPTVTDNDIAISSEWTWESNYGFYMDIFESIDVKDGQDPPEKGELIGFTGPHFYSMVSQEKPWPPDNTKYRISFLFDKTKKLVVCIDGAHPNGDFETSYTSTDYWIQNYDTFKFDGQLVDGRRSWTSNTRCIISLPIIQDLWGNYSAIEIDGVYELSNSRFSVSDIVHTADMDYAILNGYFDAVAINYFERIIANQ